MKQAERLYPAPIPLLTIHPPPTNKHLKNMYDYDHIDYIDILIFTQDVHNLFYIMLYEILNISTAPYTARVHW
mgnify:CR=1 FL=1